MSFRPNLVFLSLITICGAPLVAQQAVSLTVIPKTSRPLLDLAQALVRSRGWLVDYEDPAYLFSGDLVDVTQTQTSPSFRAANPGKSVFGVRHSPVSFSLPLYDTQLPTSVSDPTVLIKSFLTVNAQAGNPGIFNAFHYGDRYEIAPVQVKNARGDLTFSNNVLDQSIRFPVALRTGTEIVYLIASNLRDAGMNVGIGTIPINYLSQTHMQLGANGETARDVLIAMIRGLKRIDSHINIPTNQLVWRILYVPDAAKPAFMLNLEIAKKEVAAPGGGQVLVPIR